MYKINQGSNTSIIFDLEIATTNITKLSCALYYKGTEVKHWNEKEVQLQDTCIVLPLKELETLQFPEGVLRLECKFLTNNTEIVFCAVEQLQVLKRYDKTRLSYE